MNFEKAKKLSKIDPYFMKRKDLIFLVQYFTNEINIRVSAYYQLEYKYSFAHSKYMDCRFKLADTYKSRQFGAKHVIDNSLKMEFKRIILRIKRDFYFKRMTKLEKKLFKYREEI